MQMNNTLGQIWSNVTFISLIETIWIFWYKKVIYCLYVNKYFGFQALKQQRDKLKQYQKKVWSNQLCMYLT